MAGEGFVEVDFGPSVSPARFSAPTGRVTAWEPAEVPAALTALDSALAAGRWPAGYASYELGYALEPRLARLMPERRRLPLLDFGLFPGGPQPRRRAAPGGRSPVSAQVGR